MQGTCLVATTSTCTSRWISRTSTWVSCTSCWTTRTSPRPLHLKQCPTRSSFQLPDGSGLSFGKKLWVQVKFYGVFLGSSRSLSYHLLLDSVAAAPAHSTWLEKLSWWPTNGVLGTIRCICECMRTCILGDKYAPCTGRAIKAREAGTLLQLAPMCTTSVFSQQL